MNLSNLLQNLQIKVKKPNIFSHIFLIIERRILGNLTNINFYILQFLIPLIITAISCMIGSYLAKGYTTNIIQNISEFSRRKLFLIPITHDYIENFTNLNPLFLKMIDDFYDINKNEFKSFFSDPLEYDFCEFDKSNICELNITPLLDIEKFSSLFPIYKHKNDKFHIQIVNKCNLDSFLIRTKYLYSYKLF